MQELLYLVERDNKRAFGKCEKTIGGLVLPKGTVGWMMESEEWGEQKQWSKSQSQCPTKQAKNSPKKS